MITCSLTPLDPTRTARFFAERGVGVFLCHPRDGLQCGCGAPRCESPQRHPLAPPGPLAATTDLKNLLKQMMAAPAATPALLCGNQVAALEIYGDEGERALACLVGRFGALACTPTLVTPGGRCLLWSVPPGIQVASHVHRLGWGLTMRGIADFVSCASGAWEPGRAPWDIPLCDIPDWMVSLGAEPPPWKDRTIVDIRFSNGDDLVWCAMCEGTEAEWLQVRGREVVDAYCPACFEVRDGFELSDEYVVEKLVDDANAIVARAAAYYADPFRARMHDEDDPADACAA